MARGEVFTAEIQRIAAGGAGIARPDGKSVFIDLTAPGDVARFRVTADHKTWAEAELLEVLEPSAQRTAAECALYGRCGGCNLQHINYQAQVDIKAAILKDAFARIGGLLAPEPRIRTGEPFGCRNRFRFHTRPASGESGNVGDGAVCGFMERKSSNFIAVDDCPVAESGIRKALKEGTLARQIKESNKNPDKDKFTVYSRGKTFLVEGETERGCVSILDKEIALDVKIFFQSNASMLEL
ncbi:MAG: TRAM domain-containing protein, partial [Treponema sp.]|nr:TRAM domain-containing protein [Treponema sp.]